MINFKVKLAPGAKAPTKAYPSDSGWDLYATDKYSLRPRRSTVVGTGVFVELPPGYEIQIRPRSGSAAKYGVTVVNSPGTVDNNYRGELKVIMSVFSEWGYTVKKGDKIAQFVVKAIEESSFEIVEELSDSDRGQQGFGSSGNQ